MLRPLLRLYLVVILFVGASIIFIQLSFDRIFYERGAQAQRDSLTTYSFVLNDYLERHPGAGPGRARRAHPPERPARVRGRWGGGPPGGPIRARSASSHYANSRCMAAKDSASCRWPTRVRN